MREASGRSGQGLKTRCNETHKLGKKAARLQVMYTKEGGVGGCHKGLTFATIHGDR